MSKQRVRVNHLTFQPSTFKNPDSAFRVHPFWFWNGEMDEKEIVHQINEMADKGVGGFFICPRQGLTIPYLSEEWFQKVKFATETAKKLHLDVWLYDEYPYPSGMAGGEVTLQHPDAKHYQLVHKKAIVDEAQSCSLELPWGRVLSAIAVPIDMETDNRLWDQKQDVERFIGNYQAEPVFQKTGLTAYNQKRFFTYTTLKKLNWTAPKGKWEIHCFLEEEIDDFKYYGTFVDPCHSEAIKTFIELTHAQYTKSLGEEFGKTVKGMFTDETGLLGKIPWTPQLLQFFKETKGYELKDYLYALIYDDGQETARVRYDYFQSIHLLLRQAYHKQIHDWCEEHGLQYVAEVPSVRMTTQLYSHVPGGDSAHEKLGRSLQWILDQYTTSFRANPKMVSSLGNQLERERTLIECFHSIGWSMTLQDAKWMLDRLGAFGINFFNFHAFFYTLDGLKKHDAPPSQFLQNPYWEHFRLLGDYAGRLGYVMSCGAPIRQIAVLDPTTSLWTQMGNPFHNFNYSGENKEEAVKLNRLKQDWSTLCNQLTLHHKDYDHLDPELLAEAEIQDGQIRIGRACYTVLVLPPLTNLETAAWTKIKRFLEQGGVVLANGLLPFEDIEDISISEEVLDVFGLENESGRLYWTENNLSISQEQIVKGKGKAYFIPMSLNNCQQKHKQTLLSLLENHLQEEVLFKTEKENNSFLVEKRSMEDGSIIVFITNQEEGEHRASLSYHPVNDQTSHCTFQRLDLETGEVKHLSAESVEDSWKLDLHIDSYQSHLIQITPKQVQYKTIPVNTESVIWDVKTKESWQMTALQDNALRFDTFELVVNNSDQTGENIRSTVQVKTFIDQCADLAKQQKLPLAFNQVFGTPMKMAIDYPVSCTYVKTFIVEDLPKSCSILMDIAAISGQYQIRINDHLVTDFKNCFIYDHRNQMCSITSILKQGENTLSIEMSIDHDFDGVVDAIYLVGDFGIKFHTEAYPIMTTMEETSHIQHGSYPSLPYYAGAISFKRKERLDIVPTSETFTLCLNDLDKNIHDCLEVRVNGHSLGVRAWTPYQWEGLTSILKEGDNDIEIMITNTLIGLLEGKSFDYDTHTLLKVNNVSLKVE